MLPHQQQPLHGQNMAYGMSARNEPPMHMPINSPHGYPGHPPAHQIPPQMPSQMHPQMPPQMAHQMPPQMAHQMSPQMTHQMPQQMSPQMPPQGPVSPYAQQPPPPTQQNTPYPQSQHMPYQQQQPRRTIDVYAIPSAADLVAKDIEKRKTEQDFDYFARAPADLPPLVSTIDKLKLSLHDDGCVRPCHIRSSIYKVPISEDLLRTSGLEFSLVIKPFDDGEIDRRIMVPLSESNIIRCNRCKAYANPFSRHGRCCICNVASHDMQEPELRPELRYGSYEFRVTPEYYRKEIAETRRPHIIFAIEMTANSRHLVHHVSKNLAGIIRNHLPTDFMYSSSLKPLVGFVTYNSKITIYDVKNNVAFKQCDMSEALAPTHRFLIDPDKDFEAIESFLENLPTRCAEELEEEQRTVLGPVIGSALKSCLHDRSNYFQDPNEEVIPTGKLYLLHSSLPTSGDDSTPGRLGEKKTIDDMRRQLGTETESKILGPDGKYYLQLAQKCINDYATGVEIFLFPPSPRTYLNVATLGDLARLTGTGVVNKYQLSSLDNFSEDLKISLKSTMAFDAIMRVRTSTGISPVKYIGNFSNNNFINDLQMSTVNTNSNFIVQLKYDDKIPENDLVVVQFAMIYTSICGERRVRVHNLPLTTCSQSQSLVDLYKGACCDTLMNVLLRDSIDKMRSGALSPKAVKDQLTSRVISILAAYRKHCTDSQTSSSQLILPEGLKLMPVYLCGALKCDAIDGGPELFPDDKALAQINLLGATTSMSQVTFYPRMYAVNACSADDEENEFGLSANLCRCLRLIIDEQRGQCYVLENGYYLFVYFPQTELGHSFLTSVFGTRKDDADLAWAYRNMESNETKFLESLISDISSERRRALPISVIREKRDKLENVFNSFLYEDKKRPDINSPSSYVDMLCYLHSEIRSKLSQ